MAAPGPPPDRPDHAPPLIGRERELTILHDALAAALAGRGSLALIGGEAGIGKTALAERFCAEAAFNGTTVLRGRCYDLADTPPYGPWREALAAAPRDPSLPTLPQAVRVVGADDERTASTEETIARVRDYLAAVATTAPFVLLLDDLHWADPASLTLLRAIARAIADQPVLLLVAYRAEEVARGHPLYALLPHLVREAPVARLDLPPLTERDLGALVRARYRLGEWGEARLVAHLRERAQGNPFYAGELLRALEEAGVLAWTPEGWQLGSLAALGVPTLLRQVIDERVARLGATTERLLAIAAVIGQVVLLGLWAAIAGEEQDGLDLAIEQALAARLLVEAPGGQTVQFAHALIREAIYEGLPFARRRQLHQQVAERLLATAAPDPDEVAGHLQRAGDPRAAEWLLRAGERAQAAYAFVTAAERNDAAIRLMEADGASNETLAWLHLRQGWLLIFSDYPATIAHMRAAIRLAGEIGQPTIAVYASLPLATLRANLGDFKGGLEGMRQVLVDSERLGISGTAWLEAMCHTDPVQLITPQGQLAFYLGIAGHYREAQELASTEIAADAVQGREIPTARYSTYIGLGLAETALGHIDAARRAFDAVRAAARPTGQYLNIGLPDFLELNLLTLVYHADRRAECAALIAALTANWLPTRDTLPYPHLILVGCLQLLFVEGRWAAADNAFTESPLTTAMHTNVWHIFGWLARERGDAAAAWTRIGEILPAGLATEPGTTFMVTGLSCIRLAAALSLDAGDRGRARDWLAMHDRWLDWSGAIPGRAEGALGWAAYHRAGGELSAAREAADTALRHATAPRQPLALLAAHRMLGELATATGACTEAATHLDAALALADACAAPYERALTLLARANLTADSDPEAARADLDEVRAICEPLGAQPALARATILLARLAAAPAEDDPPQPIMALSSREIAVLRLVAEGLTDAEVGGRLHLARRTIGTHLANIYSKLGVATRTAAARVARERGLL